MSDDNPFATPSGELLPESNQGQNFSSSPLSRRFREGGDWISSAFYLFKCDPFSWIGFLLLWIGFLLLWIEVVAIFSEMPLGWILMQPINVVLYAGIYYAADKRNRGEAIGFADFFVGFKSQTRSLFFAGCVLLGGLFLALLIGFLSGLMLFGVGPIEHLAGLLMGYGGNGVDPLADGMKLLAVASLVLLVMMVICLPVVMAGWFVPGLIFFHGMPLFSALKLSFKACLNNIWPFTYYSILLMLLALAIPLTFGLGFIVLMPVVKISYYTSYRSIFYKG